MFKRGRKGRVSNELVGASCAAILAVYAAGHWRTRDEARRFAGDEQLRRPVRAERKASATRDTRAASVSGDDVVVPSIEPTAAPGSLAGDARPAAPEDGATAMVEPQRMTKAGAATDGAASATVASAAVQLSASAPESTTTSTSASTSSIASNDETGPGDAAPEGSVAAATAATTPAGTPIAQSAADVAKPAPPAPEGPPPPQWRDGRYTGWGGSRHGDIQAFVTIKDGKIVESGILTCDTRYPCDVIDRIINQPVIWQSPEVDNVSRATESAGAYYWGLVEALKNAEPRDGVAAAPQ